MIIVDYYRMSIVVRLKDMKDIVRALIFSLTRGYKPIINHHIN